MCIGACQFTAHRRLVQTGNLAKTSRSKSIPAPCDFAGFLHCLPVAAPVGVLPAMFRPAKIIHNSLDKAEECYIFDAKLQPRTEHTLAVSASNHLIKLYGCGDSLSFIGQLRGHSARIEDFCWAPVLANDCLCSCSSDTTCAIWDTRSLAAHTIFTLPHRKPAFSVAVNGSHVVVGSEHDIFIFDVRAGKLFSTLHDAHSNDITQIKPLDGADPASRMFATASVDGLVNVIDIGKVPTAPAGHHDPGHTHRRHPQRPQQQGQDVQAEQEEQEEDEFLLSCLNIEDSVSKIGLFRRRDEMHVFVLTHTEKLSVWSLDTQSRLFHLPNVRELLQVDYLIDCQFEAATDTVFLYAGAYERGGLIARIPASTWQLDAATSVSYLSGGHQPGSVIRACISDFPGRRIFTGGEDNQLVVWMEDAPGQTSVMSAVESVRSAGPKRSGQTHGSGKYSPY